MKRKDVKTERVVVSMVIKLSFLKGTLLKGKKTVTMRVCIRQLQKFGEMVGV